MNTAHHRAAGRDRPVTASPIRRWSLSALVALVLACLAAGSALGHAELVAADPADGAQLAISPTTIALTFSERLDAAKSSFKLLGPDGALVGSGSATANRAMTLTGLALAPGAYTIRWTSASAADGDIERGTLGFTVLAPAPASASTAPSAAPASEAPSAVAPASLTPPAPTPAPSADTAPAASTSDVLLPIVVGLVLVAGVGAFVLRRSRGL